MSASGLLAGMPAFTLSSRMARQNDTVTMAQWVAHVFDHPVNDPAPAWYWSEDAPDLEPGAERTAALIADSFERAGELLAPFSDAQLNQAFWFLTSSGSSDYMFCLTDHTVSWNLRRRALRSFIALFEQIMATHCSPHLSHRDEPGANVLNSACYMWWDNIPFRGHPKEPEWAEFDAEVLAVLEHLLAIPQDACRESALHGLGHWQIYCPHAAEIIERFLKQTRDLRPELIRYAQQAKTGCIQ